MATETHVVDVPRDTRRIVLRIKPGELTGRKRIIVRCAGQRYRLSEPYRHAGYLTGKDMRLRTE